MLYLQCKQYLLDRLIAAGLKSKPYTSQKSLERCQDSSFGAVLFDSEVTVRNGSKTIFKDQEGAQKKRTKIFDRNLTFTVMIGGFTDEEVEALYERFVGGLDQGIYVDGNYVPIETEGTDWSDDDDTIFKAKVSVGMKITFSGGLYRDTDFAKLSGIEVEAVEKINGKGT